mmetsp:Transcript_80766/g.180693  ORF Transcript_80766/g.180693 Transcript_80766/m.180693 type:complete len:232 (+) Transcript_80766:205-900(+)
MAAAIPRRSQLGRIIAGELLLFAPLRHPIQIFGLIDLGHLPAMLAELTFAGVIVVIAELHWGDGGGSAGLVREGAFAREDIVKPLREEASMQRHLAAVHLCHPHQLLAERRIHLHQLLILLMVEAAHVAHELQDVIGLCHGRAHKGFHLGEDALTLVNTTNKVVRPGNNAIRCSLQVVWDDHLLPTPGRRLIKGSQLPEIGLGLSEAPLPVHVGSVKIGEADAAGTRLVHR